MTSLVLDGVELLYLDEETFSDTAREVRGGIPILFPNAGTLAGEQFPRLPKHGFAISSSEWAAQESSDPARFREHLSSRAQTRAMYPFSFRLEVEGALEQDGSFSLTQKLLSRETDRALPIAMGLHPYFAVNNEEKSEVRFEFPGGALAEKERTVWMGGGTVFLDNPAVLHPEAVVRVHLPGVGILAMEVSPIYRHLWVWSEPGKDFVCVEPVMRPVGGLDDDPGVVPPGQTCEAKVKIRLLPLGRPPPRDCL